MKGMDQYQLPRRAVQKRHTPLSGEDSRYQLLSNLHFVSSSTKLLKQDAVHGFHLIGDIPLVVLKSPLLRIVDFLMVTKCSAQTRVSDPCCSYV